MRAHLYLATILLCFLVSKVNCQEGNGRDDGIWSKFKEMWKNFMNQMRDWWGDFMDEVKARTTDMRSFGQEMWSTVKDKLNEWVNSRNDIDESQKTEMRRYIERLQMPEDENEK